MTNFDLPQLCQSVLVGPRPALEIVAPNQCYQQCLVLQQLLDAIHCSHRRRVPRIHLDIGMSSAYLRHAPPSPPEATSEATVEVHALQAGHFSLPERFFVHPASETARRSVPSLSFLIIHQNQVTNRTTRIVFDLGLRRNENRYPVPIQKHIESRQPLTTSPDVTQSLAAGGLSPKDIDYVIYSHVSGWWCAWSTYVISCLTIAP